MRRKKRKKEFFFLFWVESNAAALRREGTFGVAKKKEGSFIVLGKLTVNC